MSQYSERGKMHVSSLLVSTMQMSTWCYAPKGLKVYISNMVKFKAGLCNSNGERTGLIIAMALAPCADPLSSLPTCEKMFMLNCCTACITSPTGLFMHMSCAKTPIPRKGGDSKTSPVSGHLCYSLSLSSR